MENREETLCPRYSAMVIENVTPGPSPQWLVDRLTAMGLKPINNIVDVTNYVMFEYGQPMHAFDRDLLAGFKIIIRRAHKKEAFASLDGSELVLEEDALVIADAEKPVALAGVMGGANSEVSLSTRTVVLESACFDPVTVRQASKKYGIRTDSSFRFERYIDISAVISAQNRAALLIRELAGGEICRERIDLYPNPKISTPIDLRVSRVNKILGFSLSEQQISEYLQRLGMQLETSPAKGVLKVKVPAFRPTLTREIDLIEEIARLHGFGNIEMIPPVGEILPVKVSRKKTATRLVKDTLCHLGFSEAVNYSFVGSDKAEIFKKAFCDPKTELVNLSNPLSSDWSTMRSSLIPGLLNNAAMNMSKGQKNVKIFEQGSVYFRDGGGTPAVEKNSLSALVAGNYEYSLWKDPSKGYDFYDLKGALETVLAQLKLKVEFQPPEDERQFLAEGKSVDCWVGGEKVGFLGEVSERIIQRWSFNRRIVYVFEIDFGKVVASLPDRPRFEPIAKFPEIYRDISLLVDQSVASGEIYDLILKTSAPLIQRVDLYDYFAGKKIEKGKKSLTFSLAFQSQEKTLTDAEVNPVFEKVVRVLSDELGARLRE
ncbi:Phenylalanyl-tRNA synthetase beta chain [hydrothermal vent metagenome]|uniref:phenylalanine--tRNA ligase n=1 Tax=hydrothermal vent metagenome TaxID=652676 RepID=A0A3B1DE34_9ZZZZ